MKTFLISTLIAVVLQLAASAEERFVLQQNSTGELWGPYAFTKGEKIGGSLSLAGVSIDEFSITGFVRGIKRTFGPFPFTNSAPVSIAGSEFTLICGSGLQRAANAAAQATKQRDRIATHSRAMSRAIASAKDARFYKEAIKTLEQAIQRWPEASDKGKAQKLLDQYRRDLQFAEQQVAKGLVKYRGQWMTPQQKQEAEAQDYLRANYGEGVRIFRTEEDASLDAMEFNRGEQAYVENRKAKVNLWLEYGMAGAPHPGPAVTFHIAKVAYDRNLGVWVRYLEVLATF